MERQLLLLGGSEAEWKLDERTKDRGRRNVAQAKAVLAAARKAAKARHDAQRAPHQGHAPHAA